MSRYNVGGTAQWLYQLSHGLSENNIENRLLVGNCTNGEKEDERLSSINHTKIAGLGPGTNPLSTLIALIQIRREIKKFRPDIVNTHTSKAGVLGRIAAKSIRPTPKVIHTYHGHVLTGYFNSIMNRSIGIIERLLSNLTDMNFVSGTQVSQDLIDEKILTRESVFQVWPGVPVFELDNRKQSRKKLGIKEDAFVVASLGRKVPIKRLDRVLEIAAQLPGVIFLIAGDGKMLSSNQQGSILSLENNNVIEIGFSSPSFIWAIADVCLLTSDNEAIPITPIEASISGKPVVVMDAGSSRETLIHGETGFLCEKNISDAITAIRKLENSPKLRKKMGSNGRIWASNHFDPVKSTLRQIEGYKKVLD